VPEEHIGGTVQSRKGAVGTPKPAQILDMAGREEFWGRGRKNNNFAQSTDLEPIMAHPMWGIESSSLTNHSGGRWTRIRRGEGERPGKNRKKSSCVLRILTEKLGGNAVGYWGGLQVKSWFGIRLKEGGEK